MTKKVITFIISMIFFLQLNAQNFTVKGKIIDKQTNESIINATVILTISDNSNLYTISDSIGKFSIYNSKIKLGFVLKITALNYKSLIINRTIESNIKLLDLGIIKLNSSKIQLKEVKIKSKNRYSDTTNIDFSNQKFERSIMIDNLFSVKNDFSKDSKGQLYYKGKPVSELKVDGQDFFGKNNLDIYKYLPALTINDIQIVETNIDSLTNATLTNPVIKVNLKLKNQYKKGLFGNANIGFGTLNRYVINASPYYYKDSQQFSLAFNTNNININDDPLLDPKINFSSNGNNVVSNNVKFTYRNKISKKIELNFSTKFKLENKVYISESERREETVNQYSKTFNSSVAKGFNIEDGNLVVKYDIDTLNSIIINQNYNFHQMNQLDSLNYTISNDNSNTVSTVKKNSKTFSEIFTNSLTYQKKFNSKKGKLLVINLTYSNQLDNRIEYNNVRTLEKIIPIDYFINGNRNNTINKYLVTVSLINPLLKDGSIEFFSNYHRDILDYKTSVTTDTTGTFVDNPLNLSNDYFRPGIKIHKIWKKLSFDELVSGIVNYRVVGKSKQDNRDFFFNSNFDLKISYKMNSKKDLTFSYTSTPTFPNVSQVTNINNTFDLVSQMQSNASITPEVKRSLNFSYGYRKSDSLNYSISSSYDYYTSKVGYKIINIPNNIQTTTLENLGNVSACQVVFTLNKSYANNKSFNYYANIAYGETPTSTNNSLYLNKGVVINQSVSTTIPLISKSFYLNPVFSMSFNRYKYQESISNITNASYSDKLSLVIGKFQINTFPLINYSHSFENRFTWAMNGDAQISFLKNYGLIWIRAYDIFNSFKYYNINSNSVFTQSVKFSNLNRYVMVGVSLKFNNIN